MAKALVTVVCIFAAAVLGDDVKPQPSFPLQFNGTVEIADLVANKTKQAWLRVFDVHYDYVNKYARADVPIDFSAIMMGRMLPSQTILWNFNKNVEYLVQGEPFPEVLLLLPPPPPPPPPSRARGSRATQQNWIAHHAGPHSQRRDPSCSRLLRRVPCAAPPCVTPPCVTPPCVTPPCVAVSASGIH
jgi:hypothetical protein